MRRTQGQLRIIALLGATALALTGLQVFAPAPAQAADAREFNASNIISDANFYNGNAMSTAQIQTFLNERVSRCTLGDPGREPGSAWGSTTLASDCLKTAHFSTESRAANAYCSAYAGSSRESAAAIIAKVGAACGISQKVLLVMLEKEQSLVTDTWPTVRQFTQAMGYACPDSGPNNSANCDPSQSGFMQQVYRAAWQYKVYRAFPGSYNYRPLQMNTIQWHPNTGCGTSQVYIENWATAALYIYTPYRPNPAALNAQWGTGDSCSTYGNRNFFMFYSTWFGSPVGDPFPQIAARHQQNPWLGRATSDYITQTFNGGGTIRAYENGAITLARGATVAQILTGDFRDYYGSTGGTAGPLGWPTTDMNTRSNDRRLQGFQNGAVTSVPGRPFVTLNGAIRDHYNSHAMSLDGPLGWPVENAVCTATASCSQKFERGSIVLDNGQPEISVPEISVAASSSVATLGKRLSSPRAIGAHGSGLVAGYEHGAIAWSPGNGAYTLTGNLRSQFGLFGGVSGKLGWPTSAATCSPVSGCTQHFIGGTLYAAADGRSGAIMNAQIADAYVQQGGSGGSLGIPVGNTSVIGASEGDTVQAFEHGAIAYSPRTGAFIVRAPIRSPFNNAGGLTGALGWPTSNATQIPARGGGTTQSFEGGMVAASGSGNFIISDELLRRYEELEGAAGGLGWPLTGAIALKSTNGEGKVQAFQGGALTHRTGDNGAYSVQAEIRTAFNAAGGIAGLPGWPRGNPTLVEANGGGTVQAFQNAAIAQGRSGAFVISGGLRTYYNQQGGLTGSLGWPTSSMACSENECRQSFQGGTVVFNSETQTGRVE